MIQLFVAWCILYFYGVPGLIVTVLFLLLIRHKPKVVSVHGAQVAKRNFFLEKDEPHDAA